MGEVDCRTCKGTGIASVSEFGPATKLEEIKPVEHSVELKLGESTRHPQLAEGECFTTNNQWVPSDGMLEHGGLRKCGIKSTEELSTEFKNAIVHTETLELKVQEEIMVNAVEPQDSKPDLANLDKLKRKYTKSHK